MFIDYKFFFFLLVYFINIGVSNEVDKRSVVNCNLVNMFSKFVVVV